MDPLLLWKAVERMKMAAVVQAMLLQYVTEVLLGNLTVIRLVLLGQFGGKIDALSTTRSLF